MSLISKLNGVHPPTNEILHSGARQFSSFDRFLKAYAGALAQFKLDESGATPLNDVDSFPVPVKYCWQQTQFGYELSTNSGRTIPRSFHDIVQHEGQWYACLVESGAIVPKNNYGGVITYSNRLKQKAKLFETVAREDIEVVQFAPFQHNGKKIRNWLVGECKSNHKLLVHWVDLGYQIKNLDQRFYQAKR